MITDFKIVQSGTSVLVQNLLPSLGVNPQTPFYTPTGGVINIAVPCSLAVGNYDAVLKLDYANGYDKTCTIPLSVIGYSTNPNLQVIGDNPFCSNGTFTLKAPSVSGVTGLIYKWYNTSGFIANTQNSQYYSANTPETYQCKIFSSATATIPLYITPNVVINSIANGVPLIAESNFSGQADRDLTVAGNPNIGCTYLWSTGATTSTINTNATGYLNYKVYVTQPNGCVNTTDESIVREECGTVMNYDYQFSSGTNNNRLALYSSMISSVDALQTAIINGDFIIDRNFTITGNVTCKNGSKIIVQNGFTLTIDGNANIHACDKMWKGIEVEAFGTLVINDTPTITDAQYGVQADNNSTIQINGGTFNRCYGGFYIPVSGSTNFVNGFVNNVTFKCTSPLAAAYVGQTPAPGTKSIAGMILNDATFSVSGGNSSPSKNVFDGILNGIKAERCNLTVNKCEFKNINAYGIYVKGSSTASYTFTQTGFGGSTTSPLSFYNCGTAILAEQTNASVMLNNMDLVAVGVRIQYSSNRNIKVSSNSISSKIAGVWAGFNDNATKLEINYNQIKVIDYEIVREREVAAGIYLQESKLNTATIYSISGNNITLVGGFTVGIDLKSASKIKLSYNTIDIIASAVKAVGISSQSSANISANCNAVTGVQVSTSNAQKGIFMSNTTNATLSCNSVNKMYNGIYFDGTCSNSLIQGNSMANYKYGLYYGPSIIIGPQIDKGNYWTPGITSFINQAINKNPGSYATSKYELLATDYVSANISPSSNWFYSSSGTQYSCAQNLLCANFIASNNSNDFDLAVANGYISASQFTEPVGYAARRELFERLSNDTSLLHSSNDFEDFYTNEEQGNGDEFENIEEGVRNLVDAGTTIRNQIDVYTTIIEQSLVQIETNNALVASGNYNDNGVQALLAANTALLQNNETQKTYIDIALAVLENQQIIDAANLRQLNIGIITNEVFEENERQVNDIYLATFGRNFFELTSQQVSTLLSIAIQCPYAGGEAVIKARGMLAQFNDSIYKYDDVAICLGAGIALRQASQTTPDKPTVFEYATLFPNPAKDKLIVNYELGEDIEGSLEIYNSLGQTVFVSKLLANETELEINISALVNAIYSYKIKSQSGFIQVSKIVILN